MYNKSYIVYAFFYILAQKIIGIEIFCLPKSSSLLALIDYPLTTARGSDMAKHIWSSFTKRIPVQADAERIFDAWTIPEKLESWFLRRAHFLKSDKTERAVGNRIQVNDTYRWYWHGWSDEVMEKGKILEVRTNESLKFIFGKAGIVEVSIIKEESGDLICELTQSEIPVDDDAKVNYYVGCGEGWTFYLTNLKSVLEGGLDLRNKKENLNRVLNS